MAEELILAIDQGTTSTRAIAFRHDASIAGVAQAGHRQVRPEPGWVEHDPVEIWRATCEVVAGALAAAGAGPDGLRAVGITNQRETTVVWDRRTGAPVHNAIVWQDTRTQAEVARWRRSGLEAEIRSRTGLVAATYFSAAKLAWILDNVDGARRRAESGELAFGTMDSWLVWKLTGGPAGGRHVTDYTNASRTMLLNLATADWDDELLGRFAIPRAMLPALLASSDPTGYGATRKDGPVAAEVPICGAAGDQQAALFGQACFDPGQAKNTYGTGCFLLQNAGPRPRPSSTGLLTTACCAPAIAAGPWFALEGSVAIAGAAVDWLRDNLGLVASATETQELARSVPDTGGAYFVPAFAGLFAPYWDEKARGVLVGLTGYVNRAHVVRAVLESICYQVRDVAVAVEHDSGAPLPELRVDGGAAGNDFLMQTQADILGIPVVRPRVLETTALGAAYLAGLAVGFWPGPADLRANWQVERAFAPQWSDERRASGRAQWAKAVERARGWLD